MPSRHSLSIFSLLTLIFPLLISAQGYDFGTPSPSLPTSSDPAQQYTPPYQSTPQGSYNANPAPNQGVYGWDPSPSPSPTDPGIYGAPPNPYVSEKPSQYIPTAWAPSNPVYGPPPANPTPPSYISPPSYGNSVDPIGPEVSSPTSSTFSAVPTISNATTTASALGAFSSLTSLSMTGGCACLTQARVITTVTHTCISTVTSVLTETVTVPTVNLVGVVSTPSSFSPAPTTLQISTVGANLNSSSTTQNGGVVSTTGVVAPTPWGYGQPPSYNQPSTYNNGWDNDDGYGASPSYSGEEGSGEAGSGSGSYGDRWEDGDGDVDTGPWTSSFGSDSEGGSESESDGQSGGGSFLDWLLGSLR